MTEPHCLCEQCKMTVLQCKERSAKESSDSKAEPSHARTSDDVLHSDKVMDELFKAVRPEIVFFSLRMEERLRKHDKEKGKHGWNGYSQPEEQDYLFRRLQEEVVELQNDLEGYRKSFEKHHEPSVNSSSETLDVADFAMMIYTAVYGEEVCNRMSKWLFGELRQQKEREQ